MEWAVPEECVGAASTCMNSFSPRGGGCDISKDADTGTCMSSFFFSFEKNEGIHVRKYSRNKCGLSSNRRVWLCSVCAPFCLAGALQVSNVVVLEKRTAAESVFGLLQYEVRGRRRLQASSPNAGVDRGQVSTCSNGLLIEGWPLAACSAAEKGPRPAEPSRAGAHVTRKRKWLGWCLDAMRWETCPRAASAGHRVALAASRANAVRGYRRKTVARAKPGTRKRPGRMAQGGGGHEWCAPSCEGDAAPTASGRHGRRRPLISSHLRISRPGRPLTSRPLFQCRAATPKPRLASSSTHLIAGG